MVITVKYALDAQNNVGIFTAELKLGDSTVVFREEDDGKHYQVSLVNEGGMLFVRIVDPDREIRGEATKVKKQAQSNEVFSVGAATVMIMSVSGESLPQTPTPKNIPSRPAPPQNHEEVTASQIGPDFDEYEPITRVGPLASPATPPIVSPTPASPEITESLNVPNPANNIQFQNDNETQIKNQVKAVREVTHGLTESTSDPSALPPVEGAKLNYDFKIMDDRKSELADKPSKGPLSSNPHAVATKKEQKIEGSTGRAQNHIRSREDLLTSDVRDRRFYLKGAKYSLRNKISALVLSLGVMGLGIYSVGVSEIAQRAQMAVFTDGVQAQTQLKASELRTRLKNYNFVLNSLVHTLSQEHPSSQLLSKGFANFDFLLGVSVYRYVPAAEVEAQKLEVQKTPPPVARTKKLLKIGLPVEILAPVAKKDTKKFRKLEDGNFLEPVVQWVSDIELNALQLDFKSVLEDHYQKVLDTLKKAGAGPVGFDARDLSFPPLDRGTYTYVVRSQPVSPIFIVIQTSSRFLNDLFLSTNDMEYFLIADKRDILFPENARANQDVIADLQKYLGSNRAPASDNQYSANATISNNWEFVGRPSTFKANLSKSDPKIYFIYGAAVLFVFFMVGAWFAKNITQPLHSMIQKIESVAAGDYHRSFDVNTNDEIGQVSDYFDYLTGQIRNKEHEIARVTDIASKDALTGLYNHRHFRSHLESKWKEISAAGGSLILIDIDDFRIFNRAHGHMQGDLVLKELAQAVLEGVGTAGLVARYGGEEIVIWVPKADQKAAFDLSEKVLKKIRSLKTLNLTGGNPFTVTCSLGVTAYIRGRHATMDQFLKDADSNLNMAKKAGKNRIWAGAV